MIAAGRWCKFRAALGANLGMERRRPPSILAIVVDLTFPCIAGQRVFVFETLHGFLLIVRPGRSCRQLILQSANVDRPGAPDKYSGAESRTEKIRS
jgi:hypothetical protein